MPAYAGEVKIIDGHGLTRAVKVVKASAIVTVESKEKALLPNSIVLSNTDGIAADIGASNSSELQAVFKGVTDGTWQIKSSQSIAIHSVKITE